MKQQGYPKSQSNQPGVTHPFPSALGGCEEQKGLRVQACPWQKLAQGAIPKSQQLSLEKKGGSQVCCRSENISLRLKPSGHPS